MKGHMKTQCLIHLCLLGLLACDPAVTSNAQAQVLVATPLADAGYDELLAHPEKHGRPAGCLYTGDPAVSSIGGDQPIFIRHRLGTDVDAAQQRLTADLELASVCNRLTLAGVEYDADDQLIAPLRAPAGSECGLLITLRVANTESRCEIPADAERCKPAAMPCAASSSSGDSSGGDAGATTGTGG